MFSILFLALMAIVVLGFVVNQKFSLLPAMVLTTSAPATIGAVVFAVVISLFMSFNQIPAGHVGVVYQFGAIVDQRGDGLQWTWPWQDVKVSTIQVQRHAFNKDTKLATFSSKSQDVFMDVTLNIRVSPDHVQKLYRDVGWNYFEVLVAPRLRQFLKDETVKYDTVDVAPSREKIRQNVRARLDAALSGDSITVVDLLIDDIDFQPGFKKSIEAKQIASQKALEELENVTKAEHMANQLRKKASGVADAIRIEATEQAKANDLLNRSLTPALIQYTAIQKLAPNVQIMMLPSGSNMILGQDMFKKAEPAVAQK
ncbi:MAG: SPFH domain-containing protein [bacterium]|nr:SPFH domain-containing protein [bacterium]